MSDSYLAAYQVGLNLLVWCYYCAKWHVHGNSPGHRLAHCYVKGSPYEVTGYYLVPSGKMPKELEKQYKDKRPVMCKKCREWLPPLDPLRTCPRCRKQNKKR